MDYEIDLEAFKDSQKALSIIFILLIVACNGLLLFSIARRSPMFMFKPKTAIVTSLAIGDIFLALFPLVAIAQFYFGSPLTCSTSQLAFVYWMLFLPFVHAVGLMALALEHIMRHRSVEKTGDTSTNIKQLLVSLLYSGVPWFLGLLVVLPLELYGFDFETCSWEGYRSNSTNNAQFWVPMIAPAFIALVVCIAVSCMRWQPIRGEMGIVIPTTHPPPHNGNADNQPAPREHYGNQYQEQYTSNQYPLQYPGYPIPVEYSSGPTLEASSAVSAERSTMLVSAIVHFVCVIPLASFYLGYVLNTNATLSRVAEYTLGNGFLWLLMLRSVITPLIWLAFRSRGSLR